MSKWIFVAESNCSDPSREDEFHEWFKNIKIPDLLNNPGFEKVTVWEINEPADGKGKYLALYEIESDDIKSTLKTAQKNDDNNPDRRNSLYSPVFREYYKRVL